MKRKKESGASYRKRRKTLEESLSKQRGSFLKYLLPKGEVEAIPEQSQSLTKEDVLAEYTIDQRGGASVHSLSDSSEEDDDIRGHDGSLLDDIGTWPEGIDAALRRKLRFGQRESLEKLDAVFTCEVGSLCFCCRLFAGGKTSSFNSIDGFSKWWKLNPKVREHEISFIHQDAVTKWDEMRMRLEKNATIDDHRRRQIEMETEKLEAVLQRLLDIVKYLAKQNQAFRGHFEQQKTQNKFIEKLGERVRQKIIERVKTAKYFTMIFDSTPDLSHKDQTSQVLRYVILDGKEVKVTESFVGFIETEKKDAAGITSMILQSLEKDGLDIQHCRGQANHSLNLAGVHAASASVRSVSFFGVIEKLFCFFSSSTHRWSALTAVAGSLKRLIETRWSARGDAVGSVKKHYLGIISVLEKLTTEVENAATRGDAAVLLGALQTHHFLVFLNLWDPVLREINSTQCYLQTKGLDLHQCDLRLRALEFFLTQNRDTLVEEALTMAEKTCGELEIPLSKPTRRNDASLSYSQEIRRDMYASMDRITQEVKSRFNQIHSIAEKYEFLIPRNLLNADYLCTLEEHSKDIDLELFVFERLIKNHLRSTMGASRLNSLAILSIEHQLTDEIDFEDVIQEFAENYARYSSNDRRLI
ncbi:uncharacterized protein LOC100901689 [Galendromus occidentalis]|uniref:Uncharacterized protein LOC100901689 n=1 Tax=Galendromus occidentalis TaxID=34638 RepID=A0AAJ7PAB2_9ACAR|nr:uncharacterized protein LOC100901689 [Galendromus occidentalis]